MAITYVPFPLSNLEIIVIHNGGYIFVTGKSRILRCDHIIQNQDFSTCYWKIVRGVTDK